MLLIQLSRFSISTPNRDHCCAWIGIAAMGQPWHWLPPQRVAHLPAGCRPRDCWHCQFSDQAPPMVQETEAHGSTMLLTWLVTSMEHGGAWQPEPETSQTFDSRNSRRNIINHLDHLSCKMSTAWESKDIKVSHAWHGKVKYKTMLNYLLLGFGFQFAIRSTSRFFVKGHWAGDPGGTHRSLSRAQPMEHSLIRRQPDPAPSSNFAPLRHNPRIYNFGLGFPIGSHYHINII